MTIVSVGDGRRVVLSDEPADSGRGTVLVLAAGVRGAGDPESGFGPMNRVRVPLTRPPAAYGQALRAGIGGFAEYEYEANRRRKGFADSRAQRPAYHCFAGRQEARSLARV